MRWNEQVNLSFLQKFFGFCRHKKLSAVDEQMVETHFGCKLKRSLINGSSGHFIFGNYF